MLKNNKLKIVSDLEYPDHYQYSKRDFDEIIINAKKFNAHIITTEKDFFLNYSSLNGVPELKRENIKTKSKKDNRREYSFELKNVAKNNSKRWFYPYIELPAYKFQVNFARTGKYEKKAYTFISSDANVIKNSVKKEDIFNFYEDQFKPSGKLNDVQRFLKDKREKN